MKKKKKRSVLWQRNTVEYLILLFTVLRGLTGQLVKCEMRKRSHKRNIQQAVTTVEFNELDIPRTAITSTPLFNLFPLLFKKEIK